VKHRSETARLSGDEFSRYDQFPGGDSDRKRALGIEGGRVKDVLSDFQKGGMFGRVNAYTANEVQQVQSEGLNLSGE
jgi:hypothetical protein